MIYLFYGEDMAAKNQKIADLKKKILANEDSLSFDYEILSAVKLDPIELKKSLLALPVLAPKRLIVIHAIQKLEAHNQELIFEFIRFKSAQADLILDSDEDNIEKSFISKIAAQATVIHSPGRLKHNVFDMTRAIGARNHIEALKILGQLFSEGNHPLQIMGGLVWYWGDSRNRIAREKFKKGLLELQQADLNIKRSRQEPEHVLEVLVVKLCSLIAS